MEFSNSALKWKILCIHHSVHKSLWGPLTNVASGVWMDGWKGEVRLF